MTAPATVGAEAVLLDSERSCGAPERKPVVVVGVDGVVVVVVVVVVDGVALVVVDAGAALLDVVEDEVLLDVVEEVALVDLLVLDEDVVVFGDSDVN